MVGSRAVRSQIETDRCPTAQRLDDLLHAGAVGDDDRLNPEPVGEVERLPIGPGDPEVVAQRSRIEPASQLVCCTIDLDIGAVDAKLGAELRRLAHREAELSPEVRSIMSATPAVP